MILSLPDSIEHRLTPENAALHLALGLFLDQTVTLGQGAAIAGLSQSAFLQELGKRRIAVHYDEQDALADAATVSQWSTR
jgi:predicted HTH domain antitoxin